MIPISASLQTSASSAAGAGSGSMFDASGFTVNIGSGSASAVKGGPFAAIPTWVYIAAAVAAVVWLKKLK